MHCGQQTSIAASRQAHIRHPTLSDSSLAAKQLASLQAVALLGLQVRSSRPGRQGIFGETLQQPWKERTSGLQDPSRRHTTRSYQLQNTWPTCRLSIAALLGARTREKAGLSGSGLGSTSASAPGAGSGGPPSLLVGCVEMVTCLPLAAVSGRGEGCRQCRTVTVRRDRHAPALANHVGKWSCCRQRQ